MVFRIYGILKELMFFLTAFSFYQLKWADDLPRSQANHQLSLPKKKIIVQVINHLWFNKDSFYYPISYTPARSLCWHDTVPIGPSSLIGNKMFNLIVQNQVLVKSTSQIIIYKPWDFYQLATAAYIPPQ